MCSHLVIFIWSPGYFRGNLEYYLTIRLFKNCFSIATFCHGYNLVHFIDHCIVHMISWLLWAVISQAPTDHFKLSNFSKSCSPVPKPILRRMTARGFLFLLPRDIRCKGRKREVGNPIIPVLKMLYK